MLALTRMSNDVVETHKRQDGRAPAALVSAILKIGHMLSVVKTKQVRGGTEIALEGQESEEQED